MPLFIGYCEKQVLRRLAEDLEGAGFDQTIEEYLTEQPSRAGYKTHAEFLWDLEKDVWYGFRNVGEEDERPEYEATEDRIEQALDALRKC